MNLLAGFLIFVAAMIIVTLRVAGLDLTEGQLLVEYWPWWTLVVSLLGWAMLLFWRSGER